MGFMSPELPEVDHKTWPGLPRAERLKVLSRHWVEHGFGTPYAVYLLYLVKCAFYCGGAAYVISLTPGIGGLGDISTWWDEPIVYQKLVVWTLLYEVLGLGCGFGPLTLRFVPPIGGFLWWLRPGTIRLPPWPGKVPLTRGDTRTVADVVLYAGALGSAVWLLTRPGTGDLGLLDEKAAIPLIVLLAVLGLRDKTIFLAARGEQYWLTLFLFFFPYVDMVVGFKLVMLALWWGAATSKLNHHFPYVVAVMMSNSPLIRSEAIKRLMYRDATHDLRPSWIPRLLAHGGTAVEFGVPAYLVFVGGGGPLTWAAIIFMAIFHLHILSTVPMGVPLEWNLFFIFSLFYLFGAHSETGIYDLTSPGILFILVPALVGLPVLGNLKPHLVSFLLSMRYYAGNWATSVWIFQDDATEARLESGLTTSSRLPINQLATLYGPEVADLMMQKGMAWRSMHTHGRALNGLIDRVVGAESGHTIRDGEFVAGVALGWNFGEGHLHDEQLLEAIQSRCGFAEGELRVIVLESQPFHVQRQAYRIHDAAAGLLEEGQVLVADMLERQPWPEDGPDYPVHLTERRMTGAR
ncbi:DUF3556 domain-containing protein [Aeromicrobium ginsengisoli]|uniref:DUF3556 domain-containing protein n=1 Tax=Aeromicrobium ginsengisoli TaxID=363867 RepID=A0A5M4FBG1_9ACTN|nr:DUF3556 domain-containing protein [Aeromicrobium ginsengisoli]KAA1395222.1 DUF3556 domain-containing protein [Aeromicrobium ginsengisoli]